MNGNGPKEKEGVRSGAKRQSPGRTVADTPAPAPLDDSQVGTVLRSVYQQTISEDIPAEMLDLLKKLS